jgi:hypothetical protein
VSHERYSHTVAEAGAQTKTCGRQPSALFVFNQFATVNQAATADHTPDLHTQAGMFVWVHRTGTPYLRPVADGSPPLWHSWRQPGSQMSDLNAVAHQLSKAPVLILY